MGAYRDKVQGFATTAAEFLNPPEESPAAADANNDLDEEMTLADILFAEPRPRVSCAWGACAPHFFNYYQM